VVTTLCPHPIDHVACEPIYQEVCAWIDQRRRVRVSRPAWPTVDPDIEQERDPNCTVRLVQVPEHLFGPWEAHLRHLELRQPCHSTGPA
jgi:hypothetical protein